MANSGAILDPNCHGECLELFYNISNGSPVLGFLYLIAPVGFSTWYFSRKAPKSKKATENHEAHKLGRKFVMLAIVSLLFFIIFAL